MDEAKLAAMQKSLEEVRGEVRSALGRLDDKLARLTSARRDVEIEVESIRDAAYEALAEVRHLEKKIRNVDE